MQIIKVLHKNWLKTVESYIRGGVYCIAYGVIESPVAIVHMSRQVDGEICAGLGYEVYESFNNCGTILCNEGDVVVGHFYKPDNGWLGKFCTSLVEWLRGKGLNATIDGNDILVDGFKVCGTCITRYGRIDYTGAFIGIHTNLDHIKAICRKPMKKVPKGLSEYGITTEEVEQWWIEFCKNNA